MTSVIYMSLFTSVASVLNSASSSMTFHSSMFLPTWNIPKTVVSPGLCVDLKSVNVCYICVVENGLN